MNQEIRGVAFAVAVKACEALGVSLTAEKLWTLVEVIYPILAKHDEDHTTTRAAVVE